jgi:hypothetical protein
VIGCAVLGALAGALARRHAPNASRRSFVHGTSRVAQVLSGVEGSIQGFVLGLIILALANVVMD